MDYSKSTQGSFRDPSGFIFSHQGSLYRQVNWIYKENYDTLINSGLYQALVDSDLLVPHQEIRNVESPDPKLAYKVVKPDPIIFISYPYEWSFSQLRDAALTTLAIQKKALEFGMTLKDSSAYNIQFRAGKPILIDTLSFEKYAEGLPWIGYRQFCQHFLAPLALMAHKDIRLNQLLRVYMDGIPLDLASSLLPLITRLKLSLLLHIHFHAKGQKYLAKTDLDARARRVSRRSLAALIGNLESTVKKLRWKPRRTEWIDYYEQGSYSQKALNHKQNLVAEFLNEISPTMIWDLGANIGFFSYLAAARGIPIVCFDFDPAAVEQNYLDLGRNGQTQILPLLIDLANPSPNTGWQNQERLSFMDRAPVDTAMALALIHHFAISNNVPLGGIARFFRELCNRLIIEFVPKDDPQASTLLRIREDIFHSYTQRAFEEEFTRYFETVRSEPIKDSMRTLYLMKKRGSAQ